MPRHSIVRAQASESLPERRYELGATQPPSTSVLFAAGEAWHTDPHG